MTFSKAVAYVAWSDGCDRASAEQQLRDALSDRKLHIRWEDQSQSHGSSGLAISPAPWWPPDDPRFWQEAQFPGSLVFDPAQQRDRTLLVLQFSVQSLWPASAKRRRATQQEKVIELLLLHEINPANVAQATREVRARWKDGEPPSDDTIRRGILKLREHLTVISCLPVSA